MPGPPIVVNNIQVNNIVMCPGWPAAWPPPIITPSPFRPPSFTIGVDILESAIAMCSPAQVEACQRGDSSAVSALLLEIMKRVHSNARQRNVFMNPKRADQVLVYIPERWETFPLREAIRIMFDRVVEELDELTLESQRLRDVHEGALAGFRNKEADILKKSGDGMVVHLENLLLRAREPEESARAPELPPGEIRTFGAERRKHIPAPTVVAALESALKVYDVRQVTAVNALEHASRAIEVYTWLLLRHHPENLTIFAVGAGTAAVHTEGGWVERSAAEVTDNLLDMLVAHIAQSARAVEGCAIRELPQLMMSLRAELRERSGAAVLGQYTAAAVEYYGGFPLPLGGAVHDARLQARAILEQGNTPVLPDQIGGAFRKLHQARNNEN